MLSVTPVDTRQQLNTFIDYPYRKYRGNATWVPPLRSSEQAQFDSEKNPFYEHARTDLFLALRDGKPVGRIAAIDDDLHNQTHRDNLLFFGYFEAQDEDVARALFNAVERRARQLGRGRIRGPANPSLNDSAGFQLDAFDTLPYIMMPQNPPAYPQWTEDAGYHKVKDLYAWRLRQTDGLDPRIEKLAARVTERTKVTVRGLNMRDYAGEVARVLAFYNTYWEDHWGQVRYTDAEALKLATDLKQIIDPHMVLFVEDADRLVGLAVGFPDANQLFVKMGGRLFPTGVFHFLNKRRIINRIRMPILGITPEYRGKGLELLLMKEFYERGVARGYNEAECSWILEDNDAINKGIKASGAELYKTYRLYQKNLI